MNLAAVIQRSKTDREAWHYTSLAEVENIFDKQRNPIPLPSRGGIGVGAISLSELFDNLAPLPSRSPPSLSLPARGREKQTEAAVLNARLVFLNGLYQSEHSHLNGIPADILQGNVQEGYSLTLAEHTCLITSPLELVFLSLPAATPTETNVKLAITLGANGRLTLIERHETINAQMVARDCIPASSTQQSIAAAVIETSINLHDQAKLVHGKIIKGTATTAHLAQTNVTVAEGAYYDHFALLGGGKLTRHETEVSLNGKLAQCRLHGAMTLRGDEHADITSHVIHAVPHTSSRQHVKSVLDGKSRGVFQGKITVAEGAQKTDGYQLSRALLLSDQAEMDAKPELEIFADDVKCSHGCSVGDLDDDMMFYLRSRGLSEHEARALLIEAFLGEVIDDIQAKELKESVNEEVTLWLQT